jgi:tRNA nucleotidyltransferase (CCA-adding enzyme)
MEVLGTPPGPHVGEALRHLLEKVLEDPELNAREPLEEELRRWWAERARGG